MKRSLIRWLWLVVLIAQIVLYFLSYSRLAGVEAEHPSWPGGILLNTIVLDSMGGFFWCGSLFFFEVPSLPRWLRYSLVGLCALVVLAVVRLNVLALIGG